MFPSNISELTNKLWRASLNLNFPLVLELFCQTEVDQFDIHTIPGNAHDIFGLKSENNTLAVYKKHFVTCGAFQS